MFGLLRSIVSIISIAYPLYRTTNQLTALQNAHDGTINLLTDTVPLSRRETELIQESLTYWISLSFWFYILQLTPIAFLVKILPLSSFFIVYVQIWLGFPVIPINNTNVKVSGSFIIYHYYFDNNMENFKKLTSKFTSILSILGLYLCHIIKNIPYLKTLLTVSNFNIDEYETYLGTMYSSTQNNTTATNNYTKNVNNISNVNNIPLDKLGSMFSTGSVFENNNINNGITQYLYSWLPNTQTQTQPQAQSPPQPQSQPQSESANTSRSLPRFPIENSPIEKEDRQSPLSTAAFILSSLLAPVYNFGEIKVNTELAPSSQSISVIGTATSMGTGATPAIVQPSNVSPSSISVVSSNKNSQNASPARSFDDFAIVGDKDLVDSSTDLTTQMYNNKRNKSNASVNSSRNSSGIDTVGETTGLLGGKSSSNTKKAYSRSSSKSSWFRSSSKG